MTKVFGMILILFISIAGRAQHSEVARKGKPEVVSFCVLMSDSEKYRDKEVRIKATYRYGFEIAELYCLGCDKTHAWVELDEDYKEHSKSRYVRMIKSNGFQGRTVNVEVIGTLVSGSGFGHFGRLPFKFVVKSLVKAEIIADTGPEPHALSQKERKKLCR